MLSLIIKTIFSLKFLLSELELFSFSLNSIKNQFKKIEKS